MLKWHIPRSHMEHLQQALDHFQHALGQNLKLPPWDRSWMSRAQLKITLFESIQPGGAPHPGQQSSQTVVVRQNFLQNIKTYGIVIMICFIGRKVMKKVRKRSWLKFWLLRGYIVYFVWLWRSNLMRVNFNFWLQFSSFWKERWRLFHISWPFWF